MGSRARNEDKEKEKMTREVEYEGVPIEIAGSEEAIWMKAKEATEARIKSTKEGLMIDEAFLEMCKFKINETKLS